MVVELPYSLQTRKKSIAIAWSVILIPPVFLNIGLFYGLWYGEPNLDRALGMLSKLRPHTLQERCSADPIPAVLALPTAILGIFTAIATIERVWKLIRPSNEFRPLNAGRFTLDIFQWGYFFVLILISALIASALSREDRDADDHAFQIRFLSLPASLLMYLVATLTLLSLVLNWSGWKVPFRFGSTAPNMPLKPAVFYIVEDVVAVDGHGGLDYRIAINERYYSSEVFQKLMWDVSVVWMLWFYVWAVLFTILVWRLPVVAVYAVGWAGPFPFTGLLAIWTTYYVKAALRRERDGGVVDERTPLLGESS